MRWPIQRFSGRSEEHTSELQSQSNLVCRLLLEKKNCISDHVCLCVTGIQICGGHTSLSSRRRGRDCCGASPQSLVWSLGRHVYTGRLLSHGCDQLSFGDAISECRGSCTR